MAVVIIVENFGSLVGRAVIDDDIVKARRNDGFDSLLYRFFFVVGGNDNYGF